MTRQYLCWTSDAGLFLPNPSCEDGDVEVLVGLFPSMFVVLLTLILLLLPAVVD